MGNRPQYMVRLTRGGRDGQELLGSTIVFADNEAQARVQGAELLKALGHGNIQVHQMMGFVPDDQELAERKEEAIEAERQRRIAGGDQVEDQDGRYYS